MAFTPIPEELARFETVSLVEDLLSSVTLGSIWTWSAFFITAVLTTLAASSVSFILSKLQISSFQRRETTVWLPPVYSSDDDDSSVSSSESEDEDDKELEERNESDEESEMLRRVNVSGLGKLSFSSFSLTDIVGGMGVVKAWDGIGLGLDRNRGDSSFFFLESPPEIISAEDETSGSVVRVWDKRVGGETPVATVRPLLSRRVAGVTARERKVLVGDVGEEIAIMDLRNLAQIEGVENMGDWWRSAARCFTLLSPRL